MESIIKYYYKPYNKITDMKFVVHIGELIIKYILYRGKSV